MCGCLLRSPYWGPCPVTQACALTGNRTGHPLVRRSELNPLSYTSQVKIYFQREGEGGRKRGRETSMCGCLSHTPNWGPGRQPRRVP